MLSCFDNVRQTNEKIEQCVEKERKIIFDFNEKIKEIYHNDSQKLDQCTDKCKSLDDLKCLLECGEEFKKQYHSNNSDLFNKI